MHITIVCLEKEDENDEFNSKLDEYIEKMGQQKRQAEETIVKLKFDNERLIKASKVPQLGPWVIYVLLTPTILAKRGRLYSFRRRKGSAQG